MRLEDVNTPALVLDKSRLEANLRRMRERAAALGVRLRPHLKTAKAADVARLAVDPADDRAAITVSTLAEARQFADCGYRDILYGVGMVPAKVPAVAQLIRAGARISIILDNPEAARGIAEAAGAEGIRLAVLVEIDCDGKRAGLVPDSPVLVETAGIVHAAAGLELAGVMTHAGGSYACRSVGEIRAMAEQERAATVAAATRLREAGLPCPHVSVGSTPTATFAGSLDGVSEFRPGVYMFQDLVMAGLGVCRLSDIAISVLGQVIGHQPDKGWVLTDTGWMAMSRDRGTAEQPVDQGYGVVCDMDGEVIDGLIVVGASQEHGIVRRRDGGPIALGDFPLGRRLRILPNHACATAAKHDRYLVVEGGREIVAQWPRFSGW